MAIFKGIIEGISLLSKEFGEFAVTKDMVGYNSSKKGKAWVNENFCVNTAQSKRQVKDKDEILRWEKDVMGALIEIGKLCSIDKTNTKNCKFHYVMELVINNKLSTFKAFK